MKRADWEASTRRRKMAPVVVTHGANEAPRRITSYRPIKHAC